MRASRGFTLAELLLAVGLLALVILTLAALITSAIRSNEKGTRTAQAVDVADALLARRLYDVEWDLPPGTRDAFWAASGAWLPPTTATMGGVDYQYTVFADTVAGVGGAGNRLKKVDLVMSWWDSGQGGGQRQGYGRLEVQASRLVSEVEP